jgi:Sel1 repeat
MASAENNLAVMYESGRGVAKDPVQALMWYRRAASHGYEKANQSAAMLEGSHAAREQTSIAANASTAIASPGSTTVIAHGAGVVPGAIICPDMETWRFVFRQYGEHWAEAYQDILTRGQSKLVRGDAIPSPDLESHGCALVPAGSTMTVESNGLIPIVSAVLPNGKTIRGVTTMIGTGNTPGLSGGRR